MPISTMHGQTEGEARVRFSGGLDLLADDALDELVCNDRACSRLTVLSGEPV